jgi:hypothetical protein
MDTHSLLIIGHIIGTILGVGGATYIEIHLNMALQDGKMDDVEKRYMGKDFLFTRIGMAIAFITGIGFIIEYATHNQLARLMDGVFWAKMSIIFIIIVNAYLLHKHKVGLYWGSAFSFVSWWTAMLLGLFSTNNVKFFPGNVPVSFISIMSVYILSVIIGAFILHKLRAPKQTTPPVTPSNP